ncbi:nuclease-related domain-containing protein [Pseudalkalibacillus salsuginis]|uniref:nuclease-related domain-containing protein n=1 Tax=Pseudalkalibacillus salsuginis TaxID=2910972 RepID=UPI001F3A512D|nr:nuclease-related domain-containing protein [Pseudalkalibacillus salsuginis]MCF6410851.1 NERD domain-containing protein [Pseudalkalibacillus salsuginis]
MAGYRGEKSIDYYLGLLSEKQFGIFHDLRLKNGRGCFQIDTLVISPSFFLIIEVKNIAGTLYFNNKKDQLIRTIEDKVEGLPDPFLQVFNQKIQLEKWLLQNKFPRMPLEHLVVISNPSTIIKTTQYIPELIHNGNIPQKVQQLTQRYKFEHLPTKELKKRSSRLLKKHTPADPDILKLLPSIKVNCLEEYFVINVQLWE